jgi:hypothetical protein
MKVDVSTALDCSAAKAWGEVQKSALLLHVIWPLARIGTFGLPDLPEQWSHGQTVQRRLYVFGFIPIGVRDLSFERIDQNAYRIVTRERDPLVRSWNHTIAITPSGPDRSIYRDIIDIDAGHLTVLVWAWAGWFYRHRQRRWRGLAKTLRRPKDHDDGR